MTLEPLSELLPAVVAQLAHHNPGRTPPMTAEPDFFDRDAEDRAAVRNWYDLAGEERANYMYGSDGSGRRLVTPPMTANPAEVFVMTVDEVLELSRRYGSAGLEVPGFRAVQLCDEVERLRAALVTEAGHVDRLVAANKAAADEVERLRNLVAERDAAVGRVRSRCDAIHTASREWDVSARPGGLLRCCEVSDLLDGREDQS